MFATDKPTVSVGTETPWKKKEKRKKKKKKKKKKKVASGKG